MTSTHALGQFLRTLPHSAVATFLALFPIVDPFGGIPIFFTMTSSWTAKDRRNTAVKTGLWVFVILVTFLFFGRFVLPEGYLSFGLCCLHRAKRSCGPGDSWQNSCQFWKPRSHLLQISWIEKL